MRRSVRAEEVSSAVLEAAAAGERPEGICVGSVVPRQNRAWARVLRAAFPGVPVLWVDGGLDFGMALDVERPEQVGHDRLANAVAGAELLGAPCIVCDFGTATTFNLVLPRRGFAGGVIAPGYGMWFDAMGRAAQLPRLAPGGIKRKTGRNTEEAIRLGARWGFRGMVVEVLWQLSKACGKKEPCVCATGGYAPAVLADAGLDLPTLPDLTLHGLARIFERNRNRSTVSP